MATPAPPSSSSRWARSGDPASAFSGMNRPARGGRGRGAPRGRGTFPPREPRPDSLKGADAAPTKSSAPPSTTSAPITDKSSMPAPPASNTSTAPSSSAKPKPAPRRASRTVPPVVTTNTPPTVEAPTSPLSARPGRRKRSQVGKTASGIPPKIAPPASSDTLLRPGRPRLPTVPHTAPIPATVKDTPPHLAASNATSNNSLHPHSKLDMRNDIDALVERVRAVAMDHHRPTTPGSHIDWAGDDDDSLPDLDDWGVTTTTSSFRGTKGDEDVISPLIVGSLRALPDVAVVPESDQSSPLKRTRDPDGVDAATKDSATPKGPAASLGSLNTSSTTSSRPLLHPSLPPRPTATVPSSASQTKLRAAATPMRTSPYPRSPNLNNSQGGFAARQIKATLTQAAVASAEEEEAKHSAPVEADVALDDSLSAGVGAAEQKEAEAPQAPDEQQQTSEVVEIIVSDREVSPTPTKELDASSPPTKEISSSPTPSTAPVQAQTPTPTPSIDPFDTFVPASTSGLSASIHAPRAMVDSVSAPASIASYSELHRMNGTSLHHSGSDADTGVSASMHTLAPATNSVSASMQAASNMNSGTSTSWGSAASTPTHTRAHTVGRPAPREDHPPRFGRRGGGAFSPGSAVHQSGNDRFHSRTHSSPPTAGVGSTRAREPHAVRPVITGDAISRLARTIVRTNLSGVGVGAHGSPGKQGVATLGE